MTPIPAAQRTFRFEYDHMATLTEAVVTLTIDPIKSLFNYTVPFVGAWITSHQELRLNDPLQAMLIDEGSKIAAIEQVKKLKEIAGISRKITVYTSDNYSCSSYGGSCSITAPIISIPRGFLTKPTETIFDPEVRAHRRTITQEDIQRLLPGAELAEPEVIVVNAPIAYEESPSMEHWKFSADEALFFIAREVANIKSNNPLVRVVSKVIFIAALFFVFTLSLPVVAGAAMMASAVVFHLIAERLISSHLDVDAIKLLEEYFEDEVNPDNGQITRLAKDRAFDAGNTAIEKLVKQNTERREGNALCRLYITKDGNNYLDLTNPFLTARIARLEEYKAPN